MESERKRITLWGPKKPQGARNDCIERQGASWPTNYFVSLYIKLSFDHSFPQIGHEDIFK